MYKEKGKLSLCFLLMMLITSVSAEDLKKAFSFYNSVSQYSQQGKDCTVFRVADFVYPKMQSLWIYERYKSDGKEWESFRVVSYEEGQKYRGYYVDSSGNFDHMEVRLDKHSCHWKGDKIEIFDNIQGSSAGPFRVYFRDLNKWLHYQYKGSQPYYSGSDKVNEKYLDGLIEGLGKDYKSRRVSRTACLKLEVNSLIYILTKIAKKNDPELTLQASKIDKHFRELKLASSPAKLFKHYKNQHSKLTAYKEYLGHWKGKFELNDTVHGDQTNADLQRHNYWVYNGNAMISDTEYKQNGIIRRGFTITFYDKFLKSHIVWELSPYSSRQYRLNKSTDGEYDGNSYDNLDSRNYFSMSTVIDDKFEESVSTLSSEGGQISSERLSFYKVQK